MEPNQWNSGEGRWGLKNIQKTCSIIETGLVTNFFRMLSSDNLTKGATPLQYPIKRRDLIELPEDYTSLLKKAAESK